MKNLSCEQNEPVRCVLRLFGASALGVQQAASAFPPEWCVTAQCRSRGAETLIALRSENAAGLDKARRSLHGCFAADLCVKIVIIVHYCKYFTMFLLIKYNT